MSIEKKEIDTSDERENIERVTRRKKYIELITTILLSAATILSAWCVYESSQWNGEQYFRIEDMNNADRKRLQNEIASQQRMAADAQLFLRYVSAYTTDNQEMMDFLRDRFPDHLKKAALAWKELDPLNNKEAPVTPLQMEEYILPETEFIEKYSEEAKMYKEAANECDNNSDNYMLLSLILSSVLFFCGISGMMESWLNQMILIILASLIFLVTLFYVIKFPVMF